MRAADREHRGPAGCARAQPASHRSGRAEDRLSSNPHTHENRVDAETAPPRAPSRVLVDHRQLIMRNLSTPAHPAAAESFLRVFALYTFAKTITKIHPAISRHIYLL